MRPNLQETAELTTFTAEIFNGKLHFFSIKRFWKTEAKRRNLWFKNRRILILTITKSWWVAVDSGYLKGMPKSKNVVWQLTHELQKKSFETTLKIFQLLKDCTNTNSRTHIRSTLFSDDNVLSWSYFFGLFS